MFQLDLTYHIHMLPNEPAESIKISKIFLIYVDRDDICASINKAKCNPVIELLNNWVES